MPPATPTTRPSLIADPLSILGTVFSEQNSRFLARVRMAKLIQRQENSSLMTVVDSSGAIQNVPASSPAAAPTELQISMRNWMGVQRQRMKIMAEVIPSA